MVGEQLYTAEQVRRVVGLSNRQYGRWAEARSVERIGSGNRIAHTAEDIVEYAVIKRLRMVGVPLDESIAAARSLRAELRLEFDFVWVVVDVAGIRDDIAGRLSGEQPITDPMELNRRWLDGGERVGSNQQPLLTAVPGS